jgi:flavin reductase (DIM6/NTAB) family NADH-FMN oxidoreductase RutF
MFYEPDKDDHGLPFNPYKSIVVPRPIGWISTISREGIVNLAPYTYSQFNNLGYDPPYVIFGTGRRKDSVRNATDTDEFVVNMATYDFRKAINVTSQFLSPDTDEAALAGLDMIPSRMARAPRVAASPVHLQCRYVHGEAAAFKAALNEARARHLFVIQMGDLVDRGPDSVEALRLALALRDNGEGLFLRANHDDKLRRAPRGNSVKIGSELQRTLDALVAVPDHADLVPRVRKALETAPWWLRTGAHLFVHGALPSR